MTQIDKLGFGASNPWGLPWHSREEARAVLQTALDGGVRHFDTAGFYGNGEAERRLGDFLHELSTRDLGTTQDVRISTKVGTRYNHLKRPYKDFSSGAMAADLSASLKRLRRDRVDLMLLHGPTAEQVRASRPHLEAFKKDGRVAAIGVCGHDPALTAAIDEGYDAIMGVYNLFERQNDRVFARAKSAKMKVHGFGPLAQSFYTEDFHKGWAPADLWRRTRRLARQIIASRKTAAGALPYPNKDIIHDVSSARYALCVNDELTLTQAALSFVLLSDFIDVAYTTTTKVGHIQSSMAAAHAPLEPAQREDMIKRLAASETEPHT